MRCAGSIQSLICLNEIVITYHGVIQLYILNIIWICLVSQMYEVVQRNKSIQLTNQTRDGAPKIPDHSWDPSSCWRKLAHSETIEGMECQKALAWWKYRLFGDPKMARSLGLGNGLLQLCGLWYLRRPKYQQGMINIWQWVKTWYPFCSHQNSWDLWMFIPLKMVCIGIDP